MSEALFEAMREAWGQASARFEAYQLIVPGSPRFICQPEVCTAYCCHAYSVNLGDAEVARMQRFEGLEPLEFLELDEDRKPDSALDLKARFNAIKRATFPWVYQVTKCAVEGAFRGSGYVGVSNACGRHVRPADAGSDG